MSVVGNGIENLIVILGGLIGDFPQYSDQNVELIHWKMNFKTYALHPDSSPENSSAL